MKLGTRLLFGSLGAAIFCAGVLVLASMVPGYSYVHQTISEIGTMARPYRAPDPV